MNNTETTMKKRVWERHGKKRFLLGRFKYGEEFWLEQASFDCGWYWGFGYIETKDSHQHYNGLALCKPEYYDMELKVWRHREFVHILRDNPEIAETVLTDAEQWELSDLMKTFYTLKDAAELYHQGNSHYTGNVGLDLTDTAAEKHINEVLLPKVFKRVYELLTPKETL